MFSGNTRVSFAEPGRGRRLDQRRHRDAAGARAAAITRDIDREFPDAGVAGPGAIGEGGGERDDLPPLFDHDDRMPAIEPGGDLFRAARLGLERGDAIGNALVVDRRNRVRVAGRRGRVP